MPSTRIVNGRQQVRVGTAGWSIPARYLEDLPSGGSHLERYSRAFPVVEIDTSFHRPHRRTTYERWAQTVGDEFRFAVKTPKALTHAGGLALESSEVLDRFLEEIEGLGPKLEVLLVQLPPSLGFDRGNVRSFFGWLRRNVPPAVALACEPRHATWSTAAVDGLLEKLGVSRIAADPSRWNGDASPGGDRRLSYFRLHGSPRIYFSDYDTERLQALQTQLEQAARESDSVWCIFDNTAHGHAIGNALSVQRAMQRPDRVRRTSWRAGVRPRR
jgi:uncharacterized protein YecE (DUF72 family)